MEKIKIKSKPSFCFFLKSNVSQTIQWLKERYVICYNKPLHRVQFYEKDSEVKEFRDMLDYDFNSIKITLALDNISVSAETLRMILMSNQFELVNPFTEWLENLPQWDGVDHIHQLSTYVETRDNEHFEFCLRKWLVATAGSIADPNVMNDKVLVLGGHQGCGKSTFLNYLIPKSLSRYCGTTTLPKGKTDTYVRLSMCPIILLEEIEQYMTSSNTEWIKSLVTNKSSFDRAAYEKLQSDFPRLTSFAGTFNSEAFLRDSANRRFLVHWCLKFDFAYQQEIDFDQLWAQAYHLYRSGFRYWFDSDDERVLEAHNDQYRIVPLEEELVNTYFEKCRDGEEGSKRYQTHELLLYLSTKVRGLHISKERLGRYLSAHGFSKIKSHGISKWIVREKPSQANED